MPTGGKFITGAQSRYTRLHFCQLVLHASLLYFFVMVLLILVFVHLFRYHFVTYQVDDVIICDATVSTAGAVSRKSGIPKTATVIWTNLV